MNEPARTDGHLLALLILVTDRMPTSVFSGKAHQLISEYRALDASSSALMLAIWEREASAFVNGSTAEQLIREHSSRRHEAYLRGWDFVSCVFLNPEQVLDFLDLQHDLFDHDVKRFGAMRAKFLYAKRSLASLGPLLRWGLHRLAAIEAVRKLLG